MKVTKEAFGDRSNDLTETFLFAKLPVHMQNELAMAGKHDATMEEIRTFEQRRCQYAQLLSNTTSAQPFNQMSAPHPMQPHLRHQPPNPNKTGRRKQSSTGNAVIAAYTDTSGRNAENGCEMKHKPNPPAKKHSNQLKLPRTQTIDPSITQNLCVKFAERWDTLLEAVTTGTRPPQYTEVFRIPNSPQKKINNSEGTLDRTTTGYTPPKSCPTLAKK